jgi:nucleoside-diphosphate-sugar epimerase
MKNILVTGCDGYIGSHLVKSLSENGHRITGVDKHYYGEYNNTIQYLHKHITGDVMDIKGEYDVVVHLAGLVSVAESNQTGMLARYHWNNVWQTRMLLDRVKTDHFVFSSTSAAFDPVSVYARTKVSAEQEIRASKIAHTIFRFFNVSGSAGYRQLGAATHLIRVIAEVVAGKRQLLEIYGDNYDTADGTAIRDYIHVMDIVAAIVHAVNVGPQNTAYECLGTSTGSSVLEVLRTFEQVIGRDIPHVYKDRRPGDAEKLTVDTVSTLVKPQYTLEEMCISQLELERNKR